MPSNRAGSPAETSGTRSNAPLDVGRIISVASPEVKPVRRALTD